MKCKLLKLFFFAIVFLQASFMNAQSDEVRISKIEVNGHVYTNSSTITLNKGEINTLIKVTYSISKNTPSYQQTGLNVKLFARMAAGAPYQIFVDSRLFPYIYPSAETYEYTAVIPNTSALIESNNSGRLFMVYSYGFTNVQSNVFPVNFVQPPTVTNNKINGSVTTEYIKNAPTIRGNDAQVPTGSFVYFWQRKNPGGNWYNINSGTINTRDYSPPASENTRNYQLRRGVQPTSSNIAISYSNEVDVRVKIGQNIITEKVEENNGVITRSLIGSIAKGGDNTFTYQWQEEINGTWTDIPNEKDLHYNSPTITIGKMYRRIVKSFGVPESISNYAEIKELKVTGNLIVVTTFDMNKYMLDDQKVLPGGIPVFNSLSSDGLSKLRSGSNHPLSIQWQIKTEETDWTDIPGANNDYFTITTPIMKTSQYRRKVSSLYTPDSESNVIAMPVSTYPPVENNKIHFDPNNVDIIRGTTPTGGTGNYDYAWAVDTHPDDSIGEFVNWDNGPEVGAGSYINAMPITSNEYHFTRYAISDGVWYRSNTLIYSPEKGIIQGKKASDALSSNKEIDKKTVIAATNNNDIYFNFKNYNGTKADIYLVNVSGGQSLKVMQADIKDNNATQTCAFPAQYLPGIYIYKIVFNDGSVQTGKIIKK